MKSFGSALVAGLMLTSPCLAATFVCTPEAFFDANAHRMEERPLTTAFEFDDRSGRFSSDENTPTMEFKVLNRGDVETPLKAIEMKTVFDQPSITVLVINVNEQEQDGRYAFTEFYSPVRDVGVPQARGIHYVAENVQVGYCRLK